MYLSIVIASAYTPPEISQIFLGILLTGIPAFLSGLAEDVTKRVSAKFRLAATITSGLLFSIISGHSLTSVDVFAIDTALKWQPASIIFTAFCLGGLSNAVNIIDGLNGLAAGSTSLSLSGLALIANNAGDVPIALAAGVLAGSSIGFFFINWPFGRLFLGDGGAYFLGFSLACISVLLVERNPSISPFAALLSCAHPVTEVLLSIYRRGARKVNLDRPDLLHFHSLVKMRYVRRWMKRSGKIAQNSAAGFITAMGAATAPIAAVINPESTSYCLTAFISFGFIYFTIYYRMSHHRWPLPRKKFTKIRVEN